MEYYFGWGLFFWPLIFFFLIWGLAWWPSRYYYRHYYGGYHDHEQGNLSYGNTRYFGKGPRNYRRSDDKITEDINDRLLINGDVDASEIEVEVNNGKVTLNGHVNSRKEKRIAEWIADSVPGVQDVENKLLRE